MQKRVLFIFPILVIFLLTSIGTVYASQSPTVNRLAGYDRYETAVQIAREGWQLSVNAVLAYGENYPDALAAVPLAKKLNAPILLTNKDSLNPQTSTVLQDLKVKIVYIVGGTAVIPSDIEKQLTNAGYVVKRISGQDKYDTAIKIAYELGDSNEVVVTTGDDYADALSIGPIAAEKQMPIILVPKEEITSSIQNYISSKKITKTYVVGDQSIISDNVVNKFSNPERILGHDKYARNIAILNRFTNSYQHDKLCLATGENFADALAGAVYAAKKNGAVALVRSDLPDLSRNFLRDNTTYLTSVTVFGGEAVVPTSLIQDVFINTNVNSLDNLYLGSIEGQTYTNEYLGLKINIPDKWEIEDISDSELLNISKKIGILNYSVFSIEIKPLLENINSIKIEDFSNYLNSDSSSMNFEYPKDIYTKKIDGIDFKVVEIDIKIDPIITMHTKVYFTNMNGYNLLFRIGYINKTDTINLNQILSSIQFSADVKNCEAYYRKGQLLFEANKYQEALDSYVEAAKISSYYVDIINDRAYTLRINSKFQTAILYYDKIIEIDKNNWTGYLQKGLCLQDLKRVEEALEYYNYAENLKPNELSILHNKAGVLEHLGRTEDAIEYLNKAAKIEPKNAFDYNNKGNVLLDLNRFEEAIVCFDKSIELDPYDPNAYNNKGLALYELGKYEEAITYYDKAIELYPSYARSYRNKYLALLTLGRKDEAAVCLKKYNQLIMEKNN